MGGDRLVPGRVDIYNIISSFSVRGVFLSPYFLLLDPQMKLSSSDLLCDGHLGKKFPKLIHPKWSVSPVVEKLIFFTTPRINSQALQLEFHDGEKAVVRKV